MSGQPLHLVIIGAMKSGTSTLFDLLATHPQIAPAAVKEPEFFSRGQGHRANQFSRYEDLWTEGARSTGKILLEASTGYTKYPISSGVPERMRRSQKNFSFIYIMRDPIKRIESQLNWTARHPWFDPSLPATARRYVSPSCYAMQLDQYTDFFERSRILLLDFDVLQAQPDRICAQVARFLKLENRFNPNSRIVKNKTPPETVGERLVFRTPSLHRAFWKLPVAVRRGLHRNILLKTKAAGKWTLSADEREEITEALREDMKKLRNVYEFDTRKWGFD